MIDVSVNFVIVSSFNTGCGADKRKRKEYKFHLISMFLPFSIVLLEKLNFQENCLWKEAGEEGLQ